MKSSSIIFKTQNHWRLLEEVERIKFKYILQTDLVTTFGTFGRSSKTGCLKNDYKYHVHQYEICRLNNPQSQANDNILWASNGSWGIPSITSDVFDQLWVSGSQRLSVLSCFVPVNRLFITTSPASRLKNKRSLWKSHQLGQRNVKWPLGVLFYTWGLVKMHFNKILRNYVKYITTIWFWVLPI